jgi:hypothetical protein
MQWVLDRLKEPSSWAGIAAALGVVGHAIPGPTGQLIAYGGSVVSGVIAILVPEKSST